MFINFFFISYTPANSKIYSIDNIKITEPYNIEFKKEKVIDKAFKEAFNLLIAKILSSEEMNKINENNLRSIKQMIDSFSIINEQFINNNYSADFEVLFSKKEVLKYLDYKNVVSSSPKKKNILFIPILLDLDRDEFVIYDKNFFYTNWNLEKKKSDLLTYMLPEEDIEDLNLIKKNIDNIENYDFKDLLVKYDQQDFIISIFFYSKNNFSVLSKIKLDNKISIIKSEYIKKNLNNIMSELKTLFENKWKKLNQINTSIRLSLDLSLNSKNIKLIQRFENELNNSDLIYNYNIEKITSDKTTYNIIYNSTPDNFINEFSSKKFQINISKNIWEIYE